MKLEHKTGNRQLVWLSALAVVSIFVAAKGIDPVDAKNSTSCTLIDPEWENCLRTHFEKRLFNFIDASDDQEKKLDALFKERMEESRNTREELREGAVELAKMFASDDSTDEQLQEKAKRLRVLHEKLSNDRLETALKVRHLLSPEQRNLISERIVNRLSSNEKHKFLKGF